MGQFYFAIILYLLLGIFELEFPAQKNQKFSGRLKNLFFTLCLIFIGGVATLGLYTLFHVIIPTEPRILQDHGIWFSLGLVFLYTLCTDLIFYWYHRAEHTFAQLWEIHELHHSERNLNATSSMRTFWLERPIQALLITIPINYIIGIDERAMVIFPTLLMVWLFFTHSNIKLNLKYLTPIICGPQFHRIHHSILPEHQNKNFAQYFPFIDYLFGTYYAPSQNEFPPTGIKETPTDPSVGDVLVKPFISWFKK